MTFLMNAMLVLGSALMAFNIYGFVRFARGISKEHGWGKENRILHVPIILLVLFLLGYVGVTVFGHPDLLVAGILFGGSIFVFVMYRLLDDISQRIFDSKDLEAKLMATEESRRAKTEFLSGVSHEMRTPMNIILGLDTMALNDSSLRPETRERLEKIGSSAKHLLSLINNILDMNSIESGDFVLKNETFAMDDVVWQLNTLAETLCVEKGLDYRCTVSDGAHGSFSGDEMRLNQVVINLIDNAVKYTDAPGSVEMTVENVTDEQGVEQIRFAVKDTGIGIGADFLPKVFDAFTKEDASTTSNRGGSGIGLAVTKQIVELAGGTITVQSERNVGSLFTVTVPLVRVQQEETEKAEVSLEGRRILIAEDILENAEIVMDLLELEGAQSEHAENGRIAVDMFRASEVGYYDAVLMDLRMPETDGLTATREIRNTDRKDAKSIPIIALTANAFESDIRESLAAGMNLHLAKPTNSEKLYEALRKCIGEAQQ